MVKVKNAWYFSTGRDTTLEPQCSPERTELSDGGEGKHSHDPMLLDDVTCLQLFL